MWTRTKALVATVSLAIAASLYGSFVEYQAQQGAAAQAQNRADLIDAAGQAPELAPLLAEVCPTCNIVPQCWEIAAEPGFFCSGGLKYGPGLGGVDTNGDPVTCQPRSLPQDAAIPCNGPDDHWQERVKALVASGDEGEIFRAIERRIEHRRDQ